MRSDEQRLVEGTDFKREVAVQGNQAHLTASSLKTLSHAKADWSHQSNLESTEFSCCGQLTSET